jgi:2-hydroxy-3-keto-5-methylthiopentenyl-1-phosphate phosphatase
MRLTQEMDIPMTIVSAGIGNVVALVMQSLMDCSHVEILSNFLYFNEEGKAVSVTHPSINSLTKFKILASKQLRSNIILLGDVTPVILT